MKRLLKLLLVLVMLVPYLFGPVGLVNATLGTIPSIEDVIEEVGYEYSAEALEFESMMEEEFQFEEQVGLLESMQDDAWADINKQELIELDTLMGTLGEPLGMQGFFGDYAIDDPNEVIEIIVQFVTPPQVALELIEELEQGRPIGTRRARESRRRRGHSNQFRNEAITAHTSFRDQLDELVEGDTGIIEIFSEHHRLFNGVYIRVSSSLVESIASLPEVYAVFPNVAYELLEQENSIDSLEIEDTFYTSLEQESINAQSTLFHNPNFMRETRELMNIDYIHHELGITGQGVRVAILDTGIYHNHPEFARFLDETGRIPGWHHFDNSPSADPLHTARSHGTVVAGAAVAIAPNMEMWHYRVALANGGGGLSTIGAMELAHADGMDVVNMSFVATGVHNPFTAFANVINLAVLDGMIFVGGAGNSGDNWYTAMAPSVLPLVIAVGNGTAGGTSFIDNLALSSSRGPVQQTYHIKPDIVASGSSVFTTNLGGGYTRSSGTSLSAPVIAGVAALLREANPDATPQEIKAMMMNTADPLADMNPNRVFAVGAGFVNPLAALRSQNLVTVEHYIPLSSNANAPWVLETMASFSFGNFRSWLDNPSMIGTIQNNRDEVQVYTLEYMFTNNPNGMASISFDQEEIVVAPGDSGTFTTTLLMRSGLVSEGFYEGYIYVRSGNSIVARLPFGLVNTSDIDFAPQTVTIVIDDESMADFEVVVMHGDSIGIENVPVLQNGIGEVIVGWQINGFGDILTHRQVGNFEVRESTRFVAVWEQVTEWEQLRQHISSLPVGAHTIYLTNSIEADGNAITIPSNREITLKGHNDERYVLTQENTGQRHFIVGRDATLILETGVTLSGGERDNRNDSGGVQVNGVVDLDFGRQSRSTLTMREGSVIENVNRTISGGAILLQGASSGTIFGSTDITPIITFNLEGGTIRHNSATHGGGVHLTGQNAHMEMTGGVVEENNTSSSGGGVSVAWSSRNSFIMTGGTIENNTAASGGGVFVTNGARFEMSGDALIERNSSRTNFSNSGGGGVLVSGGEFIMNGGTIRNNTSFRGAGVFVAGNIGMTMNGGIIYNNTASTFGGGVSVGASTARGTFTMSGGTIGDNTGPTGGGVHIGPNSIFTMNNEQARIEDNQAGNGGGVATIGNVAQGDATFNLIAGTIENNQATSGGGIHIGANANFTMTGGYIQENRSTATGATAGGGGINQIGGTVNITAGTISHNTATNQGGGIRISATANNAFTMNGGTISHNTATNGDGGGIFTTVHTNQSPLPAGRHYANITIGSNVNFSDNTAGGGAFTPPSNATTATNIAVTATRSRGLAHALNNLDINFRGGTQIQLHTVRFLDGETVISSIEVQNGEQLTTADIPEDLSREGYNFVGWSRTLGGEAETLVGATITTATTFFAQWSPIPACPAIAEGRFANQAANQGGLAGVEWRLCDDGTLRVGEGFINWTGNASPWEAYRNNIHQIIFTGPITAGTSLRSLFRNLNRVTTIEGLNYFDTSQVRDMNTLFGSTSSLIALDLSDWDTGNVTNMSNMFAHTNQLTTLDISNWDTSSVTSMFEMFWHARELTTLDVSTWDTSSVTNMRSVFFGASGLRELDLSNWDTSNVTTMQGLFRYARNLVTLDVSTWDTSNVTDMIHVFFRTTSLTTVDVSNWDVSNVRNMTGMFAEARNLTNLDLSNWDTRNVTNMGNMFNSTANLRYLNLGENFVFVGNTDLPNVRQTATFTGCWQNVGQGTVVNPTGNFILTSGGLLSRFDGNTMADTFVWQPARGEYDRCAVVGEGQFANQSGVNGIIGASWVLYDGTLLVNEGFINWTEYAGAWEAYRNNIHHIIFTGPITAGTSLRSLFRNLNRVTTIEGLNYFDTSQVRDMNNLFGSASSLIALDLSDWDTGNVTNMSSMFRHTNQLTTLDVSNWDTSSVTNMFEMFWHARQLTTIDVSNWDTSSVTNMRSVFFGASRLRELDVSNWDTSNVTNMQGLFRYAEGLVAVDVSNWDTSNVTDMIHMFFRASSLTTVDVSNWDVSNVRNMTSMFAEARNLTSLDLSNWDTRNVTNMGNMLSNTTNLRYLNLGENFVFVGNTGLPAIRQTATFTGYWQNVGRGTVANPMGSFVFTTTQLMTQFDGSTMADTFVWQPR